MAATKSHINLLAQLRDHQRRIDEVSRRLAALGSEVEKEREAQRTSPRWWHDHAGRFENDPVFDRIVGLAAQEREAERRRVTRAPSRGKKKRAAS